MPNIAIVRKHWMWCIYGTSMLLLLPPLMMMTWSFVLVILQRLLTLMMMPTIHPSPSIPDKPNNAIGMDHWMWCIYGMSMVLLLLLLLVVVVLLQFSLLPMMTMLQLMNPTLNHQSIQKLLSTLLLMQLLLMMMM